MFSKYKQDRDPACQSAIQHYKGSAKWIKHTKRALLAFIPACKKVLDTGGALTKEVIDLYDGYESQMGVDEVKTAAHHPLVQEAKKASDMCQNEMLSVFEKCMTVSALQKLDDWADLVSSFEEPIAERKQTLITYNKLLKKFEDLDKATAKDVSKKEKNLEKMNGMKPALQAAQDAYDAATAAVKDDLIALAESRWSRMTPIIQDIIEAEKLFSEAVAGTLSRVHSLAQETTEFAGLVAGADDSSEQTAEHKEFLTLLEVKPEKAKKTGLMNKLKRKVLRTGQKNRVKDAEYDDLAQRHGRLQAMSQIIADTMLQFRKDCSAMCAAAMEVSSFFVAAFKSADPIACAEGRVMSTELHSTHTHWKSKLVPTLRQEISESPKARLKQLRAICAGLSIRMDTRAEIVSQLAYLEDKSEKLSKDGKTDAERVKRNVEALAAAQSDYEHATERVKRHLTTAWQFRYELYGAVLTMFVHCEENFFRAQAESIAALELVQKDPELQLKLSSQLTSATSDPDAFLEQMNAKSKQDKAKNKAVDDDDEDEDGWGDDDDGDSPPGGADTVGGVGGDSSSPGGGKKKTLGGMFGKMKVAKKEKAAAAAAADDGKDKKKSRFGGFGRKKKDASEAAAVAAAVASVAGPEKSGAGSDGGDTAEAGGGNPFGDDNVSDDYAKMRAEAMATAAAAAGGGAAADLDQVRARMQAAADSLETKAAETRRPMEHKSRASVGGSTLRKKAKRKPFKKIEDGDNEPSLVPPPSAQRPKSPPVDKRLSAIPGVPINMEDDETDDDDEKDGGGGNPFGDDAAVAPAAAVADDGDDSDVIDPNDVLLAAGGNPFGDDDGNDADAAAAAVAELSAMSATQASTFAASPAEASGAGEEDVDALTASAAHVTEDMLVECVHSIIRDHRHNADEVAPLTKKGIRVAVEVALELPSHALVSRKAEVYAVVDRCVQEQDDSSSGSSSDYSDNDDTDSDDDESEAARERRRLRREAEAADESDSD